jgi:hypothetical protein
MSRPDGRPKGEERSHPAEVPRLKGWKLSLKGYLNGADRTIAPRSTAQLDTQAPAKSWELRTSTSLARLWQSQQTQGSARSS